MSKRCVVAFATRGRQFLWAVELAATATVADALRVARDLAANDTDARSYDIPWDTANVGIFGQVCARSDVPAEGDRIEIYRPLAADPRERRRERVQSQRRAAGSSKR
jgi:putative ubiquitin-RnfH superfamily antitoxin RatB of RatAB toxin-antitoxin module